MNGGTGGKCCSGGSFGFLNSTGVVILVACKGGAAGEGLLAVCIRALVGPLSRVDASVTGKRAGVREGLAGTVSITYAGGIDGK